MHTLVSPLLYSTAMKDPVSSLTDKAVKGVFVTKYMIDQGLQKECYMY